MSDIVFWTLGGLSDKEETIDASDSDFFPFIVMLGILKDKAQLLHWAGIFILTIVEQKMETEYQEMFDESKSSDFMLSLLAEVEIKLHSAGFTFKLNVEELKRIFEFNKLVSK